MTKFLNAPGVALAESLRGFALARPDQTLLCEAPRSVRQNAPNSNKMAVHAVVRVPGYAVQGPAA